MKKILPVIFVAIVLATISLGFTAAVAGTIQECDEACCIGPYGSCWPSNHACYCPGTTELTDCWNYCEDIRYCGYVDCYD